MIALIVGLLLGILVCLLVPPQEMAAKVLPLVIKICDTIKIKSQRQLDRIEKENEEKRNRESN